MQFGDAGITLLCGALKSNTTLTELNLSCQHKRNKNDIHQQSLFFSIFIFIKSTGSRIEETSAMSLCDLLKSNATITELNIRSEPSKQRKSIWRLSTLSLHIKPTVNNIGEAGATSMSEVLKSNSALITLDLTGLKQTKEKHKFYPPANNSYKHYINSKQSGRHRNNIFV